MPTKLVATMPIRPAKRPSLTAGLDRDVRAQNPRYDKKPVS